MSDVPTTAAQPHLYLVDGSSYIFRAYHRLPPLTNRHGQPAGAVYGYTTMLWKLADGLTKADGPSHMAVILDASERTHRNEMYAQYKAQRPPPPEDLVPQFPMIRDATRAFSIPCIEEAGLEADDIIACYVTEAKKAGWKVTIVSSDKDLMQLIDEDAGIDMLDTMNDRRIGHAEVVEKFGVPPGKVGDVLALMGDSVDNVPGVPGIGPKTASLLIQQFGDLETVLASTDQITKPKLKQSLIDHADNARLSRELVRLVCDAALPQPIEELKLLGIPPEPLRVFLEDQGFKSLLNRLNGSPQQTGATVRNDVMAAMEPKRDLADQLEIITVDRSKYETLTSEAALDAWIGEASDKGYLAIDTETDCIDCIIARLVGISLATAPNRACYIPLEHGGADLYSDAPDQLPSSAVLKKLKPLLEDPAILKIGHNFKYDWVMFEKLGITVAPVDDTMVMSFDLDAGRSFGHGLDELAKLHLGHECISYKSLCGTGSKQITFDKVPLGPATEYAAEDADITLRLWLRLKPRLALETVSRVYERVDRPLIPVISRMERRGSRSTAIISRNCRLISGARSRRSKAGFTRPHAVRSRSAPRSSSARFSTADWVLKEGGKAKAVNIRPMSTSSSVLPRRGSNVPGSCSNGGSSRSSRVPTAMLCSSRSTRILGACIQASVSPAPKPDACRPTIPIFRTFRSEPRSAEKSGTLLSPMTGFAC